jgi:hypothetical protein
MLIDRFLPDYDVTYVCETSVDAPPDETYAAIRETSLRDPVVDLLFALRELPHRIARRLGGEPVPPPPAVTFSDMVHLGPGWVSLAEEAGVEFVVGAVGKFWRKDYGNRPVTADQFMSFGDPGYAKLAISLAVRPSGTGTMLRYEARTATTDDVARRTFRRYWTVIRTGVALVMHRALQRIRLEAEQRADGVRRNSAPLVGVADG